jgi:hypothetical protein
MPGYKIHRLKETVRQQFRWAPHASGATGVKPKDYEPAGTVEAPGLYAAWDALRDRGEALRVGDLLETESGELRICKYVGFEEARWVLPEVASGLESLPPAAGAAGPPEPRVE